MFYLFRLWLLQSEICNQQVDKKADYITCFSDLQVNVLILFNLCETKIMS